MFNSQITSDHILVQQGQIHSITTVSSVAIPTFSKVIFKDKKTHTLAFRNIPQSNTINNIVRVVLAISVRKPVHICIVKHFERKQHIHEEPQFKTYANECAQFKVITQ